MTRKDEITRNNIGPWYGSASEQKLTHILYDISVTLAMMYDLMLDEKKTGSACMEHEKGERK